MSATSVNGHGFVFDPSPNLTSETESNHQASGARPFANKAWGISSSPTLPPTTAASVAAVLHDDDDDASRPKHAGTHQSVGVIGRPPNGAQTFGQQQAHASRRSTPHETNQAAPSHAQQQQIAATISLLQAMQQQQLGGAPWTPQLPPPAVFPGSNPPLGGSGLTTVFLPATALQQQSAASLNGFAAMLAHQQHQHLQHQNHQLAAALLAQQQQTALSQSLPLFWPHPNTPVQGTANQPLANGEMPGSVKSSLKNKALNTAAPPFVPSSTIPKPNTTPSSANTTVNSIPAKKMYRQHGDATAQLRNDDASAPSPVPNPSTQPPVSQSTVAPSVEPLLSFLKELSQNLTLRETGCHTSSAPTPIEDAELASLIQLTYATFTTDMDLMNFIKANYPMELCLQLRDFLAYNDSVLPPPLTDTPTESPTPQYSLVVRDFDKYRGTLTVSLMEILGTLPSPCTAKIEGNFEPVGAELTGYCPLMKCIMRHFDHFVTTQRGCIGLLRVISSTANAPRPVDRIIRAVTARLERLIFDPHANYIVSHVLCALDEWPSDAPHAPKYMPLSKDEVMVRTASILALAAWGREGTSGMTNPHPTVTQANSTGTQAAVISGGCPFARTVLTAAPSAAAVNSSGSKVIHGAVPPRRAMASPQAWRGFIVRLCEVLGDAAVNRVGSHREASHILEHAIRRVPFAKIPEALPLLHRLVDDVENVLAPLCHSPCGRHCVQALAETLATKSSGMKFSTVRHCIAQLATLQPDGINRALIASSPFIDRIDVSLRRLPSIPREESTTSGIDTRRSVAAMNDAYDY